MPTSLPSLSLFVSHFSDKARILNTSKQLSLFEANAETAIQINFFEVELYAHTHTHTSHTEFLRVLKFYEYLIIETTIF